MIHRTRSVGASTFCSGFLQPTVTSTSTVTIDNTNTITSLTTETTTTTTIATESIVATVTCAASSPTAVTCNVEAYGFGTNLIDQTTGVDPIDCHEHCLANPACKSFQVQTGAQRTCNIFKVATAGNVQAAPGSGFTFFDRNCIDYLPAQCTPAAMPKMAKRAASIPSYLATVPATRISSACSCFIASPSPTFTNVVFESMTVQLYTTTTLDTTITATETDSTTVSATAVVTAAP